MLQNGRKKRRSGANQGGLNGLPPIDSKYGTFTKSKFRKKRRQETSVENPFFVPKDDDVRMAELTILRFSK